MGRIASSLADGDNLLRPPRIPKENGYRTFNNRNGLKRSPLKRGKRLSPVSRLRRVAQKVYRTKREKFMREHPVCQHPECNAPSFDPHHANGREGKNYLDTSTWIALCREHHIWVHAHPNQARKIGLLK